MFLFFYEVEIAADHIVFYDQQTLID